MVKLELYRVFREVAEAGNISLAAENLYLSQSAVSQSVKQLEQQLGTRLFLRSPRGVTLTEDGRLLFEYVRSAMGLLETGEDKLQQSRTLQAGTLVIRGIPALHTGDGHAAFGGGEHRSHARKPVSRLCDAQRDDGRRQPRAALVAFRP